MAGLKSGDEPFHVTLTTADGVEIGLLSVSDEGKPVEFEGALTPVDATEQFRPGGIPREWNDFSAGGGYSFYDQRVPNGYAWAKNIWTLIPHVALPSGELTEVDLPATNDGGTHSEIRVGLESSSDLYVSTRKYCVKIPDGTGTATQVLNFASTALTNQVVITSVCMFLGKAYWGGYDSVTNTAAPLIQHTLSSDTFTAGSATCARWQVASFYGVDGQGEWSQWMVGTVASNAAFKYTNSASPLTDANWTPGSADGTPVGDPSFPINRIVTARQAPFFMKGEGAFIVQRFGVAIPNITPHWQDGYYAHNGLAAVIVAGKLYASLLGGIDMILGLDGQLNDTPRLVHPGADLPNETPVAGECQYLARDGEWIIAALWNNSNQTSYVCWGKPREAVPGQPGLTPMIWHMAPLVIEGERVTWLHKAAPGGVPRLWVATTALDGTTHLYWMSLPRDGNIVQELNASGPWRARTDTCTLYLSSNPWSQGVHSLKAVRQVATVTTRASDYSYMDVFVAPDGGTRVQLGARVTESPYVESRITADVYGRQLAPSVDMVAGTSTSPPLLRAVTVWAGEGIRSSTTYRGRFRFAQGMKLRTGGDDVWADPEAVWNLIVGAQGPRNATLTDWKGTVYTVAFEQGAAWKEREIKNQEHWEIDAILTFTVLSSTAVYNAGYVYDGGIAVYEA